MRQVVDQFQVDGVLDTGDITDWGSAPENQLIGSVGDARRPLRLHPRQPRLRGDGVADRRAAQRHGARGHGHDGGRHRDRRRRRPPLHPRQDHGGRRDGRRGARPDRRDARRGRRGAARAAVDRPGPRPEAGTAPGRRRPPDPRRAHARPQRLGARGRLPAHGAGLDRRRRSPRPRGRVPRAADLHRPLPRPGHRCAARLRRDHPRRPRRDRGDHPAHRRPAGENGAGDQAGETDSPGGAPASPTG